MFHHFLFILSFKITFVSAYVIFFYKIKIKMLNVCVSGLYIFFTLKIYLLPLTLSPNPSVKLFFLSFFLSFFVLL